MLIPFYMLWDVQMQWRRKLALAGIFSLVIVTMIFAILRTALVGSANTTLVDSSWLLKCSAIEASVGTIYEHLGPFPAKIDIVSLAIIVACLATFRDLFSRESPRARHAPQVFPGAPNGLLRRSEPCNWFEKVVDTFASEAENKESTYQVKVGSGDGSKTVLDTLATTDTQLERLPDGVHAKKDNNLFYFRV